MKGEYLSNSHSISALDRIANSKDRPLTLIGQFTKEEMEEVHLMLRHGLLDGQVVQAPPNHVHYLLRVDRINAEGTRLLIEAFPQWKKDIAELPEAQVETEAMDGAAILDANWPDRNWRVEFKRNNRRWQIPATPHSVLGQMRTIAKK